MHRGGAADVLAAAVAELRQIKIRQQVSRIASTRTRASGGS